MNTSKSICYRYDPTTKILLGEEQCYIDPLEFKINGITRFVLPANATFKVPPEPKEGSNIVYNETENYWDYQKIEVPKEPEPPEIDPIEQEIHEKLAYLYKTDWYVIREYDLGIPVPEDIKKLRIQARDRISELRNS